MNYKPLLCLLIFLKVLPVQASQRDTIRLFYNINQTKLSPRQKTTLDSVSNLLSDTTTMHIYGFADYLGKREANVTLSKARADSVKNYLLTRHRSNLSIVTEAKGQVDPVKKNISPLGEPFNRRTDIVLAKRANGRLLLLQTPPVKGKDDSIVYKRIADLPKFNVGDSLSFMEFTFQPGQHLLRQSAVPYMVALKDCLKKNPTLKIELQGHICCQYDGRDGVDLDTHTSNLSLTRAKFIYDYLVAEGISAGRLSYKGLGSKEPKVYPELNAGDQNQNRRVVIVLTGK